MVAYVRMCLDVLGDVLQFGTRRHLSALERIGRNFHAVIAERFVTKPFLNLTLQTFFDRPDLVVNRRVYDDELYERLILAPKDSETIKTV